MGSIALAVVGALAACNGDDGGRASASDSATGTATMTVGTTGTSTGTATDASATETSTGSASNSDGTSTTTTTTSTTASTVSETGTGTTTTTTTTTTTSTTTTDGTTDGTTGVSCDGMGGQIDFSYLWVANTDQGSIAKVNTLTLTEEGRYWSDAAQSGASDPSRTSVNIDGHYVVVSNRGSGNVTKVAASKADCIDKNQNGVIETSPDKDTLLNYAEEECILWTTKVNAPFSVGSGPRGTAWTPGVFNDVTCKFEDQKVWVGYLTGPGQAEMARLNGDTGAIEATVPLPGWPLTADGQNGYSPYGAAADAQGYIWTTAVFSALAYRIDPVTLEVKVWTSPLGDSHYGMTVDGDGRVWFANWTVGVGVTVFDPASESWTAVAGSEGILGRGIGVDSAGSVWTATNPGGTFGCGLLQASTESLSVITHHTFDQCGTPLGISVDAEAKVWMVDYNGWAYQVDPNTYEKKIVPINNTHYTYSDMTGFGLKGAVMPG
ncbi:MAG: lyase [Nannocystaceae bacterium]